MKIIALQAIRLKNLPYILYWVIHYMWVVVFTTWWTYTPYSDQVFTYEARSITHAATLVFSAILIMFCKKEWFVTLARAGSTAMLAFMAFYLFALTPEQQRYAAPVVSLIVSVECMGIFVPYILLMNNTEKYYSMLIAFAGVNIFGLLYQQRFFGSLSEKIAIIAIVAVLAALAVTFRKKDLNSVSTEPLPVKPPRIAVFSLIINCFSCIFVKGIGKVILDSMETASPETAYFWHFTGGLGGCALYFIIFALVKGSLQTVQNITFGSFLLAVISFALYDDFPQAITAVAFFTGLSGTISMISLYYNLGVIGGKYRNVNHLKQALWCAVFGGGGSVLIGNIAKGLGYDQTIVLLAVTSVSLIIFYYLLLPFLVNTYYKQQWIIESEQEAQDAVSETLSTGLQTKVDRTQLPEGSILADGESPHARRMKNLITHSFSPLTRREYQLADCIMRGLRRSEIAKEMDVLPETVTKYTNRVYSKFVIHSRQELFRLAETLDREWPEDAS